MLHKLRTRAADQKGFTLIELLVVILIIGILAAIAIPAFLNQRDKANDSKAKADARTAQTAMETYLTDSSTQAYDGATEAALEGIEKSLTGANFKATTGVVASGQTYSVTMVSQPTNNEFTISRASDGTISRPCTVASADKKGGCRITGAGTSGTW